MSKTFSIKSLIKKTRIKPQPTIKKPTLKIKGDALSKGKSEAQIEAEICSYLKCHQILHWKIKIKGEAFQTPSGIRFKASANKGFSDIHVCYKGLAIYLEVKKFGGLASEHQLETQIRVKKAGGIYEFVTSVNEVKSIFDMVNSSLQK